MQKQLTALVERGHITIYALTNIECANNCIFYKNKKEYMKCIYDILNSIKKIKYENHESDNIINNNSILNLNNNKFINNDIYDEKLVPEPNYEYEITIRPSLIMTRNFSSYDVESSEHYNSISFQRQDNNQRVICEECEQKLKHTENFLYTY